jgi:undecaprenyl diphosphate synthase
MPAPLRSLAITPDGNRRYAQRNRLGLDAAYTKGFEKVKEVGDWALETGVRSMTVWGISHDNFRKRSSQELGLLFKLMGGRILEALEARDLEEKGVRVRFIGRLDLLPESLVKGMRELEERTADNRQLDLNVAVAYGGRDELLHAARETAREVARGTLSEDEIDEARFARHLYLPEPVDLMVRTGGQRRLSGFLPWQSDYAELYFTDKLWPEFSRADYDDALAYFESVQRNFGR